MPYKIEHRPVKSGKDYAIINKDTHKVVGRSTSKKAAQASVRARYANEGGKK